MNAVQACECARCGEQLDSEELEFPYVHEEEDGPICERCDDEHYRDYCHMCETTSDKTDFSTDPGKLIAILEPVPALCADDLSPGFYRVKRWPFFADGMIEGYFFGDAVERVGDLDARALSVAKNAWSASCPMCSSCQDHTEKMIVAASTAANPQTNIGGGQQCHSINLTS